MLIFQCSKSLLSELHSGDFCKPERFTWGDLHLSLRFTRLQIYNFSKKQGFDLQLLRRRGPHWFATKQPLCFSESMKAFWGDFALVDNLEKVSWKVSGKKFYFRKNYDSNKARKLKVLSNFIPVLLCIINDFSFNERLNSKCFLSFQQNSIYRCNIAYFFRLFKEAFKDQFQAQIGNNAFKKLDCRAYTCPSSTNSKVLLCIIVSALDRLRRWDTTDVFNLFA